MWWKKVDKIAHSMNMNVNELINEVEKTRELLKKNPGDKNMQVGFAFSSSPPSPTSSSSSLRGLASL